MRLRIRFSKTDSLRYIGHLDLQRVWERTFRRAGLPLVYSQGFHPQPKIQIASALPLGFIGHDEIVDVWLEEAKVGAFAPVEIGRQLQRVAPQGLILHSVEIVDERAPALQTQVLAAEYRVTFPAGTVPDLSQRVQAVLAQTALPRRRREREYDLRPLILQLKWDGTALLMTLSAKEGATGRPEEVLDALNLPVEGARIERLRLILSEQPYPPSAQRKDENHVQNRHYHGY